MLRSISESFTPPAVAIAMRYPDVPLIVKQSEISNSMNFFRLCPGRSVNFKSGETSVRSSKIFVRASEMPYFLRYSCSTVAVFFLQPFLMLLSSACMFSYRVAGSQFISNVIPVFVYLDISSIAGPEKFLCVNSISPVMEGEFFLRCFPS